MVAGLVTGTVLGGAVGTQAAIPSGASVTRRTIAPGVVYQKIVDPAGPWEIFVVKIAPESTPTVDPVLAGNTMGSYAKTSVIAQSVGAIAAINGDFGGRFGEPAHAFADDGSLMTSGMFKGSTFGVRHDKQGGAANDAAVRIRATDLSGSSGGVRVAKWNVGVPKSSQIRAYTSFGATSVTPPTDACSVRLVPSSRIHLDRGSDGVYRSYDVKARVCGGSSMNVYSGNVILSSRRNGTGSAWIKSLSSGGSVRVRWSQGTPQVVDVIGGYPLLLQDGRVVATICGGYICLRHPRTAIGVTARGSILLVVVDGRRSDSIGMNPRQLALYMRNLGAVDALNLDGGGGATMWVTGLGVVNQPSGGYQRAVTNAVVVLPGQDAGERISLVGGRSVRGRTSFTRDLGVVTGAARARAIDAAMRDAGSTGGLADLMVRLSGGGYRAGSEIQRIAERFRLAR